jgi:hypothetical protein
MKITKFLFASLIVSSLIFVSCTNNDDIIGEVPEESVVILSGELNTMTLTKDKKYLIQGQTFVRAGKVLTIQAGTIIKGDKATKGTLVIDKGGRIEAKGTANEPIVMTSNLPAGSRDRGDWGGLVILGNAPVNQTDPSIEGITPAVVFGGTVANDNSGTLEYVRVEYAGIELTPNNETNSITLGAVGNANTGTYQNPAITNPGIGYDVGDTVSWQGLDLGGSTPTNNFSITVASVNPSTGAIIDWEVNSGLVAATGNGVYSGIAGINITPAGTGVRFDITRTFTGYTAVVNGSGGANYVVGNRIVIGGNQLNGTLVTNDAVLEVLTVNGTGGVLTVAATGTTFAGETITIYPTLTLSDATVGAISQGTTLNVGAIATIEATFTSNHGLVPGSSILTAITSQPTPSFTSTARALPASATWQAVDEVNGRFVAVNGSGSTTAF